MHVLAIIHHDVSGAGVFADEVRARGHSFEEWEPADGPLPRALHEYGAVLAFGGGMQADDDEGHPWLRDAADVLEAAISRRLPTLGVCLGGQMLARAAGGGVRPSPEAEWGWRAVELTDAGLEDPLFAGGPRRREVFQWHSYAFTLPPGAVLLASNAVCLQAFRVGDRAWGLQWHPEVTADTARLWARDHVPAPGGVPVSIDLDAHHAEIDARIDGGNAEGRALCGRFLAIAEGDESARITA